MKIETQSKKYAQRVHKGHVYTPTQASVSPVDKTDVTSRRQRNAAAQQLLHEWLADTSGYDEEAWPTLKQALEANRFLSNRRLFRD